MPKWTRFRLPGQPTHPSNTEIIDAYNEGGLFGEGGVIDTIGANITEAAQKVDVVLSNARAKISSPLATVERVADKAIPASLAACASLQYTGGVGSFANFLQPITLRTKYFYVDGDRSAYIGKPLNAVRQLSTLTGFVQCENVRLDVGPLTLDEMQIVKMYLESGCIIE